MATDNGLLAQSPSMRIRHFKDFAVAHTTLVEVKDRLLEAITESAANSLIIVSGPTGVGKTTLLEKTVNCSTQAPSKVKYRIQRGCQL